MGVCQDNLRLIDIDGGGKEIFRRQRNSVCLAECCVHYLETGSYQFITIVDIAPHNCVLIQPPPRTPQVPSPPPSSLDNGNSQQYQDWNAGAQS